MLILSRKLGERVVIGNSITVTILDIQGTRVRLGFAAPADVPIHREEICLHVPQVTASHV